MAPSALGNNLARFLADAVDLSADQLDHSARNVIVMCVGLLVLIGVFIWWLRR
jgi:hypothetical protein